MVDTEKILLVGPSGKIRKLTKESAKEYKSKGYKIFSYTDSIFHLQDIGIKPDYFSFLDPYTIGRKIDFYEKHDFISETDLLIPDIFSNNLKKFYDFGFTCNSFKRVYKHLYDRFLSFEYEKSFNTTVKKEVVCVDLNSKQFSQESFDYKEQYYIFSSYGKINIDKFSCMIIPMVINHFKALKEIRCIGFGDLTTGRFYNNRANGCPEFAENFKTMKEKTLYNLNKHNIKISFEEENHFSKELCK